MDSAIHLLLNKRGQCGERQGRAKFLVEGDNVGARLEPRSSDLNLKVLNPQPPRLFVMEMEHLLKGKWGKKQKEAGEEQVQPECRPSPVFLLYFYKLPLPCRTL